MKWSAPFVIEQILLEDIKKIGFVIIVKESLQLPKVEVEQNFT